MLAMMRSPNAEHFTSVRMIGQAPFVVIDPVPLPRRISPDLARVPTRLRRAVQQAGADLLVLECVPAALAKRISTEIGIPTIGIGAGVDCDGQVLVLYDMLGITPGKRPRFSKDFLAGCGSIGEAIQAYADAVRSGEFPGAEHSF